jgi:proton-translocating NADH-quinone oxidoreductase chain L|tara:strand:- start:4661 stop:6649 length:1989 start_codon:yes stop_codon:yes gene_type:complete
MLILIVLLPLLGFFSGSVFGRFIGWGSCYITTGSVFLSLLLSLFLFYDVVNTGVVYKLNMGSWITVDSLNIDWSFCFDSLTSVMLIVVTFISTLVHLYSTEYMEYDPHLPRFMSYLSLFTFFMLILITANNFLQMFVGWEGVGLSSYLLINFWFTRVQANKAAIKAMLVNRIGDFSLLLAIFAIYFVFNSLDYDTIFSLTPLMLDYKILIGGTKIPALDMICIFLFLGAMGKSAQLGLHTWLPDAMEGPTPVSALIHAATMVTAGVFLLARCSHLFEYSPLALNLIIFIGSATAFFASTTGLFQNDMKRVIAYSTCSQLGYMVFACGLSSYEVGIFHLANHAFFKALLFLGAGSVIHAVSDEQDMRKMGGLRNLLPFTYSIMVIGSLALMGFPFLTGFYSKDTILEVAYAKYTVWGHFSYYLGTFAAFFTAFYSIRLLFLVFLAEPNGHKSIILKAHEGSWRMTFPLFILSLFSIGIGFLTRDLFIGFGTDFWGWAIFVLPQNYVLSDIEFISLFYKLLPLMISLFGAFFAYFLYSFGLEGFYIIKKTKTFKIIYNFLNRKWYFDRVYNQLIGQQSLNISYNFSYKSLDRGIIEKLGPSGIVTSVKYFIKQFNSLQSGQIYHYLFLFLFFTMVCAFFSIYFNNLLPFLNSILFLFFFSFLIK